MKPFATNMKRLFALVLTFAMLLPMIPMIPAQAVSPVEHKELSRQASADGQVLLENRVENGTTALPIAKGATVALFGRAQIDYVRGGGGSGETNVEYTRNILQGMQVKEGEGKISLVPALTDFYTQQVSVNGITNDANITIPADVWSAASNATENAVVVIGRYSSEGADRKAARGDYYLSEAEIDLIRKVSAEFEKTTVVLNVGAVMDTSWIKGGLMDTPIEGLDAVLVGWQGGMEGGLATADILVGDVNPSGKTVDTWAKDYSYYPSASNFNESNFFINYTEDIFVGYRYFETVPGAAENVNYEFGYGLSYTTFDTKVDAIKVVGDEIVTTATVTNTGSVAGKQVVQVYFTAPRGKLTKPAKELAAFDKTDLLAPGASQTLEIRFPITDMSSYDDMGVIQKSAYVMEAGTYRIFVGNSVRDGAYCDDQFTYVLENDLVAQQLSQLAAPTQLPERMLEDGSYEQLETSGDSILDLPTNHQISATEANRVEMEAFVDAASSIGIEGFYNAQFDRAYCISHVGGDGVYVEYMLTAEKAGKYAITLSFANGNEDVSNPFILTVNGVEQTGINFFAPRTGDGNDGEWYNFVEATPFYVTLNEGVNLLRYTVTANNPNYDYMRIAYAGDTEDAENKIYANGTTRIEAENWDSIGGTTGQTELPRTENFNGGTCVAFINFVGNYMTYDVFVEEAGAYDLVIYAANGRTGFNFQPGVFVNDEAYPVIINCPQTGDGEGKGEWYNFAAMTPVSVNLPAGHCTIKLCAPTADYPNVDAITLTRTGNTTDRSVTVSAADTTTVQAENFNTFVVGKRDQHPCRLETYSGGAVVAFMNFSGNQLGYYLNVEQAGTYDIVLHVANGGDAYDLDPLICVNGTVYPATLACANTGGWQSVQALSAVRVELPAGQVYLTMTTQDGKQFPNLDAIAITPVTKKATRSTSQSSEIIMLADVYYGDATMEDFVAQLSIEDLAQLLSAQGNRDGGNTQGFGNNMKYGIPLIMTADGPQGIRIADKCTAWPISTNLSCTWDVDLIGAVGKAAAVEAHAHKMDIWLAPGMNIHRDPLCGRNFEYYSEDPLLTGKLATAITKAVQSEGVAISLKHFVANNREANRSGVDTRVSERALREIYLRGFEIAVKEADPWTIMSSYNLINGTEVAENWDLITGILRTEWGYNNVVETDWLNNSHHVLEVLAGNDVKMTNSQPELLVEAVQIGKLTRAHLEAGVTRVLELVMKTNYFKEMLIDPPTFDVRYGTLLKATDHMVSSSIVASEDTTDYLGGKNVSHCDEGAFAEYWMDVQEAGEYELLARIASPAGTGAFKVLVDGVEVADFDTPNTGDWQKWTTIGERTGRKVMLTEGFHTLRLEWTESGSNLNWIRFAKSYQVDFEQPNDGAQFDLYHSSNGGFTVADGKLIPAGDPGEFKAIYNYTGQTIYSASVELYPNGEDGTINGGLYVGASAAGDAQDAITALYVGVESICTGWEDAPNRVDLLIGSFPTWKEYGRVISETGLGNNLFTGGKKEPVRLRVDVTGNTLTATVSLVSDPSKYIATTYVADRDLTAGQFGIRSQNNDAMYDNFTVVMDADPVENPVAFVAGQNFYTVQEAVEAANGEAVTLLNDTNEAIVLRGDATIDLAGKKLSNVTVESGSLQLIDTVAGGSANVKGSVETFTQADGKNYLVVGENDVYSAHEYSVVITHISLAPVNDALGYKAQVEGDAVVQAHVKSIGFNLWLDGGKVRTYEKEAANVTLRLKNILANNGGESNINATAFVTLAVGENTYTKTGTQQTTTMKDTLQTINAAWDTFTATQQAAVKALCDLYPDTVSGWNLTNIYPAA